MSNNGNKKLPGGCLLIIAVIALAMLGGFCWIAKDVVSTFFDIGTNSSTAIVKVVDKDTFDDGLIITADVESDGNLSNEIFGVSDPAVYANVERGKRYEVEIGGSKVGSRVIKSIIRRL